MQTPSGRVRSRHPIARVQIGNGHHLFARDWGCGPTVIFLAGWGLDSRIWGDVMRQMNVCGFRTLAYDRRGHGLSSDPGEVDYDLLAEDLATVVKATGEESVTLVAHSGAAGEAIRYACRHGTRQIKRLVFVAPTGPRMLETDDGKPGIPRAVFDKMIEAIETRLPEWIEENQPPFAPGAHQMTFDWLSMMILGTSRQILVDYQREIATTDLTNEASALDVPVVVVHARDDASAPYDLTAKTYEAIVENCTLSTWDTGGHGLMISDSIRLAADIAGASR